MNTDQCIFFQLAKASQAGTRYWGEKVSEFGVTAVQGMVLGFLAEEDEITSGSLGSRVQLDSATLTGILDRLNRAGFLERKINPDDRRAILVCLTDKGKAAGKAIRQRVETENRAFLSNLTDEENVVFRTLLQKVVAQHT